MAKITITIEDLEDGTVKTEVKPPISEILMKITKFNDGMTSADGYALICANAIREANDSAKLDGKLIVKIPKYIGKL